MGRVAVIQHRIGRVGRVTITAVTVAALIAMAEINRLVAAAVDDAGQSRALGDVVAPAALGERRRGSWAVWSGLDEYRGDVAGWIGIHTALDLLFVLGYAALVGMVLGGDA